MKRNRKIRILLRCQERQIEKWLAKMTPEEREEHDAYCEEAGRIVKARIDRYLAEMKQKAELN